MRRTVTVPGTIVMVTIERNDYELVWRVSRTAQHLLIGERTETFGIDYVGSAFEMLREMWGEVIVARDEEQRRTDRIAYIYFGDV
jgi:hypothetical protein